MTMSSDIGEKDPLSQPDVVLDQRFRVGTLLGEGPVHRAFHAFDILEGQDVCLKIPKPKFRGNDGFAMRYRRDLLDVMILDDPNWLTPLLLAEHEGVPIQVLPLLDGLPFADWFEMTQRSEERLIAVLVLTLQALERLHRTRQSMHGSIKPSNLYVCEGDEPLFTDLAATGRLEDHFTEKASSGEPVYCSPEQLCGERADASTDLYSLGLVVYEALARRHPFFGPAQDKGHVPGPERLLASLLHQLQTKPTPASSYSEDVPRWADRFLARCLHPHPEERFSDASEALTWLRHHTKQERSVSAEQRTVPPAGREQEMGFLSDQLTAVLESDQGGSMIRLCGELGSGKTRCLSWLVDQAKARKMRVVVVESIPESGLHLQSIVTALPDLESEEQPIVESLLALAMEEPILMIIKDIQQADDTLVEFLKELSSVLADLPLMLILVDEETTFRSTDMRLLVTNLELTLRLGPLDRRAIANLIEEKSWTAPTSSVCSWIHATSGGNALHATLLVEYLQKNGLVSDALELSWTSSPPTERPSISEIVSWKLESLTEIAQSLLEIAAVLGHPFRLSTLNAITYRHEEEVDEALGEGVSKGLLELARRTGVIAYRWKHPRFRQALLSRIHTRRKQRIHRLAAAYYSRGVPEPGKLAYHFFQAGDLPELFHWGSLAIERANSLNRRGECIYWMNVLLSRIPENEWLGPDVQRARRDVSKDQADALDLEAWARWLRTLSGREIDVEESTPLMRAQHALSFNKSWSEWKELVAPLLPELDQENHTAITLLRLEWKRRCRDRELFPLDSD